MKRIKSPKTTHLLLPVLAIVLLAWALGGSVSTDQNRVLQKSLAEQEDSDQQVHFQAFQAVVPIVKVIVGHELYLIFELTLLAEFDFEQEPDQLDLYRDSYLRILFGRIISIHAP